MTSLVALTFTAIKTDEMGHYQAEDCFMWEKSIGYTMLASQGVALLSNLSALIKKNSRHCIRDRQHEVVPESVVDRLGAVEEKCTARGCATSPVRQRVKSMDSVVWPLSSLGSLGHVPVSRSPASAAADSPASPPGLTS